MKKIITVTLSLLLMLCSFSLTAFADNTSPTAEVYVTVSSEGTLALTQEKITVTDTDSDGKLTINDALYLAHEAKYEGGAAEGYTAADVGYGTLSIIKLWGVQNNLFGYGYYVNNISAMGLTDEIKSGDYINAFSYSDLNSWSDTYCYFDVNSVSAKQDDEVTLTLSATGWDASFNQIAVPVENAVITINGTATEYKTDAEGKVTVKLNTSGKLIVSAKHDTQNLVPPVIIADVKAKEEEQSSNNNPITPPQDTTDTSNPSSPKTGYNMHIFALLFITLTSAVLCMHSHRKINEK